MKICDVPGDVLVTHALGSCLGVTAYDPVSATGGMLHLMLPFASINPEKAEANPFMFVDAGVPEFFKRMRATIGRRTRLVVKVAGGAETRGDGKDFFATGKRNYHTLRKVFWTRGILIDAEDVGNSEPRTMHLAIGSGRVWVVSKSKTRDL